MAVSYFGDDKKLIHQTEAEFREAHQNALAVGKELHTHVKDNGQYFAYNPATGFTVERHGATGYLVDLTTEQAEDFREGISEEEINERRAEHVEYLREKKKEDLRKEFGGDLGEESNEILLDR